MLPDGISAILFDKDGTLFDFAASWSGWADGVLDELSAGQAGRKAALADAMGFDLHRGGFDPSSPVIAGTLDEAAELLLPHLPDMQTQALITLLLERSIEAEMVAPVPLAPFLDGLLARGLVLGVATNDGQAPARAHLDRAGVRNRFAHVLGYDSGYTPKPAPDMLLGFASLAGLAPNAVVMVGDSTHDLIAGRAAGMPTVGVLTGLAVQDDLAPYADVVVPHIGHLNELLALR